MPKKDPQMLTYDDLAELFGLPTLDSVEEGGWDYVADGGDLAYAEAKADGATEDVAEEAREEAWEEAQLEIFRLWSNAVEAVAEHEFGEVGLGLQDRWHETGGKERFWVVPVESWRYSATQIMEIVNGVGYFHFDNLKDFLDSGPYTPREAVLTHLHWLKDRAEVYGDVRPAARYDTAVR